MQPEARGFPLSLSDAVAALGITPSQLRGYVRGGLLPCLLLRARTGGEVEWFNPDDLTALHELLSHKGDAERQQRRIVDIVDGLHAYLAENPPLADYDQAIQRRMPVLARSRQGRLHAHVQSGALADWIAAQRPDLVTASIETTAIAAMESLDAVRIRGLSPLNGGKQRWQYWFRLPLHVWSASPELESLVYSLAGAREDEEQVTQRGHQPPELADSMRVGND